MRAVLDPNVLVSALLSPAGPPAQVVLAWDAGRFQLIASPRMLSELANVLSPPKLRRWIDASDADEFVSRLQEGALLVDDPPPGPKLTPDPDDDYLVALARAAEVDYLVSGDGDLTGLADPDPPVLTPREFLDRLAGGGPS